MAEGKRAGLSRRDVKEVSVHNRGGGHYTARDVKARKQLGGF